MTTRHYINRVQPYSKTKHHFGGEITDINEYSLKPISIYLGNFVSASFETKQHFGTFLTKVIDIFNQ
jgi:hypothetical protein